MTDEMIDIIQEENPPIDNQSKSSEDQQHSQRRNLVIIILVAIALLALIIWATVGLLNNNNAFKTAQIRDVFIIFLALESMVSGIALVILIVQLSTLINLLQNEIRPILNSTSDTVNTLKGTAKFVSDNLTEPVIKINQYIAMLKRLVNPTKK